MINRDSTREKDVIFGTCTYNHNMQLSIFFPVLGIQFVVCLSRRLKVDPVKFKDCSHVRALGHLKNSTYTLWMNDTTPFKVRCEHGTSNSFTVILRRMYGTENFYRGFHDYQYGFGHPQGDYWAGLNQIYYLTSAAGNNILTINMQDWYGNNRNVRYNHFRVNAAPYFQLSIGSFQGQVPDDLSFNNGMYFATYDKPDAHSCAVHQKGGWWYNYCTFALPTGVYYHGGPYTPSGGYYDGIYWKDWQGYGYSLKYLAMTVSNS
ncbi:angiopoietin-related protein 1-like [Saccostrea echinata]|uniref:angiopoietin-related protein 1-like n=1 Tax=Saccostrea echinata TaxID=191078 RepID=UPI002A801D6A|nr:angiopoietin-related protein 1-like [Saccostrea echinata]